jgi:hypothetical protein
MPGPGILCLNSFKADLKDPDSGKVISFESGVLTYTATNSYGARIQGKALCEKSYDNKWTRNRLKEIIMINEEVTKRIRAHTACLESSRTSSYGCGGDSAGNLQLIEQQVTREFGF